MSAGGAVGSATSFLTDNHMGLDCLPISSPCWTPDAKRELPEAMTHLPEAPCPFAADHNPIWDYGTCCSLRGQIAARELEALGESELCERMYEDMSAEQAIALAVELLVAADRLEREHAGDAEKPTGAAWNCTYDFERMRWVWETHSTFADAIASIRCAARWYDKVGRLGFGVHAR